MADHTLSLAVNGCERDLQARLTAVTGPGQPPPLSVAIVGLGYVGLPTALALHGRCQRVIGVDVSPDRLAAIRAQDVDLGGADRARLAAALADGTLELTGGYEGLAAADAVIICVPTPVDGAYLPDLAALRTACADVAARARTGQTIILTSTTYVGTTRELLADPIAERGLKPGSDVFVAFSPERIDPGNPEHLQRETPRLAGGVTGECAAAAASVLRLLTDTVYLVSSPDAAEAAKLYENVFRAVSLALANEFADACGALGLDPVEVTLAAGTKPYGFLGVMPGPGVGGHCIPCDPHYLLWQLGKAGQPAPLIGAAMRAIAGRPLRVAERAAGLLAADGLGLGGAKVVVVGASYKPGVADLRESPAIPLMERLRGLGALVSYHDPLAARLTLPGGESVSSLDDPRGADFDLAIIHTVHPGFAYRWVGECPRVLDATYRFDDVPHRTVV